MREGEGVALQGMGVLPARDGKGEGLFQCGVRGFPAGVALQCKVLYQRRETVRGGFSSARWGSYPWGRQQRKKKF